MTAHIPSPGEERSSRLFLGLRADGGAREDAVRRLHAMLLLAARADIARRGASVADLGSVRLEEVAQGAADDATVSVLRRLDDFRGESRFTTWAYKFAVLETGVKLRRARWEGRELPAAEDGLLRVAAPDAPDRSAEQRELLLAVAEAIRTVLTARQREVLVALAIDGVPIDVLADRLGSTRGALYKTLHDARRRLRGELLARGVAPDWMEERP